MPNSTPLDGKIIEAVVLSYYDGPTEFMGLVAVQHSNSEYTWHKTVYGCVTDDSFRVNTKRIFNVHFASDVAGSIEDGTPIQIYTVNEDEIEWSNDQF